MDAGLSGLVFRNLRVWIDLQLHFSQLAGQLEAKRSPKMGVRLLCVDRKESMEVVGRVFGPCGDVAFLAVLRVLGPLASSLSSHPAQKTRMMWGF